MGRVRINGIQEGMVLGESIYHPKNGKLLLKQGTKLGQGHIEKIRELGIKDLAIADPFTVYIDIHENMTSLLNDCYRGCLKKMSSPHPEGNMNDEVLKLLPMVRQSMKEIAVHPEVCRVCVDMQVINFDKLVKTGVYTSGYAMFLAALAGMDQEQIRNVGIAGLLHDVGMCEMYQLVDQQEIGDNNRALWEQHPLYGHYMMNERDCPREVTELIACHHEKFDGSGFPKGLKGDEIPLGARIIALCADYEENIHHKGYLPYEAIEYIYGNSKVAYDPRVVKWFTENVPVYPLGAVVELSTGETGVIVNIRKNKGPRPVVQVQYNRVHKPVTEPHMVDLGVAKTVFIKKVINY